MQKLLYSKSWLYKIKLNSFSTSNQVCSVKVILSNSTVCTSHMRNTSGNSKEMWKLKIMSTKQFFTKSEQVLQETILASWWWFCNRVGFRWKVVGDMTGWLGSSVVECSHSQRKALASSPGQATIFHLLQFYCKNKESLKYLSSQIGTIYIS